VQSMAAAPDRPETRPPVLAKAASTLVLVMVAQPVARLVASPGGAGEPLVHAPEYVPSGRIGGGGVGDEAVLVRGHAHARTLPRVSGHVGPGHSSALDGPVGCRARGYLGPVAGA